MLKNILNLTKRETKQNPIKKGSDELENLKSEFLECGTKCIDKYGDIFSKKSISFFTKNFKNIIRKENNGKL